MGGTWKRKWDGVSPPPDLPQGPHLYAREPGLTPTLASKLQLPGALPGVSLWVRQVGGTPSFAGQEGSSWAPSACTGSGGRTEPRARPFAVTLQCVAGYHGVNCSEEVNECLSQPCRNGGTCIDLTNTYKCSCPRGTQGRQGHTRGGSVRAGGRRPLPGRPGSLVLTAGRGAHLWEDLPHGV